MQFYLKKVEDTNIFTRILTVPLIALWLTLLVELSVAWWSRAMPVVQITALTTWLLALLLPCSDLVFIYVSRGC